MRRTLIALAAAGALAIGTAAMPTEAEALPVWVVPVIVASAVVGVVVGAVVAQATPVHHCSTQLERTPGYGWHRVRVCS